MNKIILDELKRIWQRIKWSWSGFKHIFQAEKSLRQWLVVNAFLAVLAFILPFDMALRGILLAGGIGVMAMECMNTAIERVVDDISLEKRNLAKQAKDCGSAGVAVSAIGVGVCWIGALKSLI